MSNYIYLNRLRSIERILHLGNTPKHLEPNAKYAARLAKLVNHDFGLKPTEIGKFTNSFIVAPDEKADRTTIVIGTRYGNAFVFQKGLRGGGVGFAVPIYLRPLIQGLDDTASAKLDLVLGGRHYNEETRQGVPNIGHRAEMLHALMGLGPAITQS